MKKVIFRKAQLYDAGVIAEFHYRTCKNQPESFMDKLGVRFLKKYYQIILSIDETIIILAFIEKELVGFHSGTLDYQKQLNLLNRRKNELALSTLFAVALNPLLIIDVLKRFLNKDSNLKYYKDIPRGEYWAWDKESGFPIGSIQMHKYWHQYLAELGHDKVRSEININNKKVLKLAKSIGAKEIDFILDQSGNSRLILEYNLHEMRYPF